MANAMKIKQAAVDGAIGIYSLLSAAKKGMLSNQPAIAKEARTQVRQQHINATRVNVTLEINLAIVLGR
jgi:hypothetical protein